ncbi:elongation factor P [Candidatus Peregrinibacteria bacterium CG_4_9_14_0_2_um_filter_53_11]|nr:MAG: elongation factor P [Candidatus Peregrinibacteria bacterium CG_4_9_14_0_2_um_filter_53_11]
MAQSLSDLKVGQVLKYAGEPYIIVWNSFVKMGRGKPSMRTKLRGVANGKVLDKTFVAGEDFELANIEKTNAQYLYNDGDLAYFMDSESYEQFELPVAQIEGALQYLNDGTQTIITRFESKPIGVELPPKVVLAVTETPPGLKGDTAQGGTKPATMETGIVVSVPLFIEVGEKIRVNTETGDYVERANN